MKNFISKNVGLIKICSVVLFAALMAFNVVITQNTHGNTSVDLSLSGLKAMALGSGEGGGGGCDCGTAPGCTYDGCSSASYYFNCLNGACTSDCNTFSCSETCVEQVGSIQQQTIVSCGPDYG